MSSGTIAADAQGRAPKVIVGKKPKAKNKKQG
jgi:hypothetical protein